MNDIEKTNLRFSSVNKEANYLMNEYKNNNYRDVKVLERIPDEIGALRAELASERQRAEKAEASNKRYSLYIAIISGIISSVVSVSLTFLFLR